MIDMKFKCLFIILNSMPESLLLVGKNDAKDLLKLRIEVLTWMNQPFKNDENL